MGPARHAKHSGASEEVKDLSHQWSIYGFHLLSIQYPSYGDGTHLPGGVPKPLPKNHQPKHWHSHPPGTESASQ